MSWKGFTFDWYVKLWDNTSLLEAFGNTMIIAVVSTLLATIIGTLGAIGMYRYKFKGKALIDGLLYIPVASSKPLMAESETYSVHMNTFTSPFAVSVPLLPHPASMEPARIPVITRLTNFFFIIIAPPFSNY